MIAVIVFGIIVQPLQSSQKGFSFKVLESARTIQSQAFNHVSKGTAQIISVPVGQENVLVSVCMSCICLHNMKRARGNFGGAVETESRSMLSWVKLKLLIHSLKLFFEQIAKNSLVPVSQMWPFIGSLVFSVFCDSELNNFQVLKCWSSNFLLFSDIL